MIESEDFPRHKLQWFNGPTSHSAWEKMSRISMLPATNRILRLGARYNALIF